MTRRSSNQSTSARSDVCAVVAIGRNEGERLKACLSSISAAKPRLVYVDSGSTDQSVAVAQGFGAMVVRLDISAGFTAARARNAGFRALMAEGGQPDFIQFVDGDCVLADGWLDAAAAFLNAHPDVAAVCGRRRERRPEHSIYNALCDLEWDTPVGEVLECGGDVMMRASAFIQAGGYSPDLIAGEEPELCVRLRSLGWSIWRIDRAMTLHDANMTKFRQWWARSKRAGYAFAQVARMHRNSPFGIWRPAVKRALVWGALGPVVVGLAALVHPAGLAALMIYPAQICRLALRRGGGARASWRYAVFATASKFPEMQGVATFYANLWRGRAGKLIEYK